MELYYMISVVSRRSALKLVEICRELSMPMTLTNMASGTAKSEHLSLYNLQSTPKAVVSTVTGASGMKKLMRLAKLKLYIDIPGNGIMMAIPIKSVGGARSLDALTGGHIPEGGKPEMQFEHELIVVVLNEGCSDMVMDAARSAGARGGTVLHAKGTGTSSAPKFFGGGKGNDLHRRHRRAEGGHHARRDARRRPGDEGGRGVLLAADHADRRSAQVRRRIRTYKRGCSVIRTEQPRERVKKTF